MGFYSNVGRNEELFSPSVKLFYEEWYNVVLQKLKKKIWKKFSRKLGNLCPRKGQLPFWEKYWEFKTIVQPLSATPGEKDSGCLEGAGRLIEIKPIEKLPLGLWLLTA